MSQLNALFGQAHPVSPSPLCRENRAGCWRWSWFRATIIFIAVALRLFGLLVELLGGLRLLSLGLSSTVVQVQAAFFI